MPRKLISPNSGNTVLSKIKVEQGGTGEITSPEALHSLDGLVTPGGTHDIVPINNRGLLELDNLPAGLVNEIRVNYNLDYIVGENAVVNGTPAKIYELIENTEYKFNITNFHKVNGSGYTITLEEDSYNEYTSTGRTDIGVVSTLEDIEGREDDGTIFFTTPAKDISVVMTITKEGVGNFIRRRFKIIEKTIGKSTVSQFLLNNIYNNDTITAYATIDRENNVFTTPKVFGGANSAKYNEEIINICSSHDKNLLLSQASFNTGTRLGTRHIQSNSEILTFSQLIAYHLLTINLGSPSDFTDIIISKNKQYVIYSQAGETNTTSNVVIFNLSTRSSGRNELSLSTRKILSLEESVDSSGFGRSIAINDDNDLIVVLQRNHSVVIIHTFKLTNSEWTKTDSVTIFKESTKGHKLVMSGDGKLLEMATELTGSRPGRIVTFDRSSNDTSWIERTTSYADTQSGGSVIRVYEFARSLNMSEDNLMLHIETQLTAGSGIGTDQIRLLSRKRVEDPWEDYISKNFNTGKLYTSLKYKSTGLMYKDKSSIMIHSLRLPQGHRLYKFNSFPDLFADWQISKLRDFSVIEHEELKTNDTTNWNVPSLDGETTYYLRHRYYTVNNIVSDWSDTVSLYTNDSPNLVETDVIVRPSSSMSTDFWGQNLSLTSDGKNLLYGDHRLVRGERIGKIHHHVRSSDNTSWIQQPEIEVFGEGDYSTDFSSKVIMTHDKLTLVVSGRGKLHTYTRPTVTDRWNLGSTLSIPLTDFYLYHSSEDQVPGYGRYLLYTTVNSLVLMSRSSITTSDWRETTRVNFTSTQSGRPHPTNPSLTGHGTLTDIFFIDTQFRVQVYDWDFIDTRGVIVRTGTTGLPDVDVKSISASPNIRDVALGFPDDNNNGNINVGKVEIYSFEYDTGIFTRKANVDTIYPDIPIANGFFGKYISFADPTTSSPDDGLLTVLQKQFNNIKIYTYNLKG